MKAQKFLMVCARGFILLSSMSLVSVSVMAFHDPQAVMDLVNVKLTSNDAYSSIRGVYGGVGLSLFISLLYLMVKDPRKGLAFLSMLWGLYAISRTITIYTEGALGDFGNQWLGIETSFFLIAIILLFLTRKSHKKSINYEMDQPGRVPKIA